MGRYAAEPSPEHLEAERRAASSRRDRRLLAILFGLAALVAVIDQLSKQWAIGNLSQTTARPLIGEFITLQLTFNPGAAFGLASGTTWIFTVIAIAVAAVVIRVARHIGSVAWTVCLGLLLGGAIGNLIDRLFRDPGFPEGHVVDFLNYANFFIGNIADIAIVGAAIGIAVLALIGIDVDGTRPGRSDGEGEGAVEDPAGDAGEAAVTADDGGARGVDGGLDPAGGMDAGGEGSTTAEPNAVEALATGDSAEADDAVNGERHG
nr:signal peptidase II [Actinomycetales bacterium]